ncbi:MAG: hypothetical protein MUF51_04400 [Vicinamibacteria bacterium]|jgi:predicted aldo/keto reductase-like oxidoreductase|nr:hypothetical protein [Vicinamibacteria bacterium]
MKIRHCINRRQFIGASAGLVAGGVGFAKGLAAQDALAEAVSRVGRLPRKRFDRGKREVSLLIGASDWSPEVIAAGIACGVNYWHKAQRFVKEGAAPDGRSCPTPAALLKDRDAHYCEVVVDRIGGGHETGTIDEQAHYQFVKQSLDRSGLRYFDDMVFHYGFHTVDEYKQDKSFVRAYERLKKEGLVRHLGLTQHNYNGNAKVPGGQSAAEILTEVMRDGLYEHAQIFFSFGDDESVYDFVRRAREKEFGTIAMKTTRGATRMLQDPAFMKDLPPNTTPHHALARWLTTAAPIGAAVIRVRDLREFADTYSGAGKPMRAADDAAVWNMTAFAEREVCRLCNVCQPQCPQRLPIADLLRCERYALDYRETSRARAVYADLGRPAARCVSCERCVAACPIRLPIPAKLARLHRLLA